MIRYSDAAIRHDLCGRYQVNVVYAVASHAFTPNSAFAASDNTGVLAQVDLTTGNLSSIVTGMKSPHGAVFVPSLPLGF